MGLEVRETVNLAERALLDAARLVAVPLDRAFHHDENGGGEASSEIKARCLEAAKLLKHEATKVALAFNDGPETVEHNTEIINDFVKVAVLLAGFVREGCVGRHAGPTLVKALSDYVSQIVGAARTLVRAVGENNTSMLARSAGMVIERCDQLSRAPFDSRAAVIRQITKIAVRIRDIKSELDEIRVQEVDCVPDRSYIENGLLTNSEQRPLAARSAGGAIDDGFDELMDDDDDDGDPVFLIEDMAAVLNAKDVVDKSGLVLKGAIRVINKALANDTDTVEQILQACESLSASLDEIGSLVYPPHDRLEFESASRSFVDSVNHLQSLCIRVDHQLPLDAIEELKELAMNFPTSCNNS